VKISQLIMLLVACGLWARSCPIRELRLIERELGYDLLAIQGIRPGMAQAQVTAHLGKPSAVEHCSDGEIWTFQPDYKVLTVYIESGKVQGVSGVCSAATVDGYRLAFLDRQHVRKIFGPPTCTEENLLFYRLNHRELAILFRGGKVTRVTLSRV
jgi:hypothetical protein